MLGRSCIEITTKRLVASQSRRELHGFVYLFVCFKEQRLLLVHTLEVCAGREEVFIHDNSWKKTQASVPFIRTQTMLTCYRL